METNNINKLSSDILIKKYNTIQDNFKKTVLELEQEKDQKINLLTAKYVRDNAKFKIGQILRIKNVPIYIKVDCIRICITGLYAGIVVIKYQGLRYKKTAKGYVRTKSNEITVFHEDRIILAPKI